MARFVILVHDFPFEHWDFLLEGSKACRTWRLLQSPDLLSIKSNEDSLFIRAEAMPDHRIHYLTYEGPVSNGRGTVVRWDSGEFISLGNHDDECLFTLYGERLSGTFQMSRRSGSMWVMSAHSL